MSEEGSFRYFNKNNGDLVNFPRRNSRLESYQNWVTVTDDDHLADLQAGYDGTRSGRGNLLGSSNVGDRIEARHQVEQTQAPETTSTSPADPDPEVTEPPVEPDPVVTPDPEPTPEPDPVPTPLDPADRPARSATKAEWVDWAVKAGASREEAESMTKTDLIEVYGE